MNQERKRMRARLWPVMGGASTRFQVSGTIPTAVPQSLPRELIYGLSLWGGCPVSCVLCVDRAGARWCEWWTELMAGIPGHHLEAIYLTQRTERVWRRR
jgi:hypothetical protein